VILKKRKGGIEEGERTAATSGGGRIQSFGLGAWKLELRTRLGRKARGRGHIARWDPR